MDRPARLIVLGLACGLAACTSTPPLATALRLEDRPANGVVRVHNSAADAATVWYNYFRSFADGPLMLQVRWRDRDRRIVYFNGTWPGRGWWTPLALISSLCPIEGCPRRSFTVPGRSYVDLERNVGWFTRDIRDEIVANGPCQIQFVLRANQRRRSRDAVEITSEWQPADCPRRTM